MAGTPISAIMTGVVDPRQAPISPEQPQHIGPQAPTQPVLPSSAIISPLGRPAATFETGSSSVVPTTASGDVAASRSPLTPTFRPRLSQFPSLESYSLFNMPEPFSWTPTVSLPPPPVLTSLASNPVIGAPPMPFAGPTFSGQAGVHPLLPGQSSTAPGSAPTSGLLSTLSSQLVFSTPNVTNIVTTRFSAVEDYLPWRTQFESFLVSHSLLGIVDGSIVVPSPADPDYHHWLKIDQTVRSWIFATLARDILMEVYDLKFSHLIWVRLEHRFSQVFTFNMGLCLSSHQNYCFL
ncbi:unnamed protein product [Cuscuta epithymum]|uniref:Retrotransposon Copia-like N-terminal domain-containing protein n=1 Tax=Cuscuta epithymum TaxID=186058 RepID=A0AAV0EYW2_9ASTE|nr:unnamed protein product [Cuscuta epithymum]